MVLGSDDAQSPQIRTLLYKNQHRMTSALTVGTFDVDGLAVSNGDVS